LKTARPRVLRAHEWHVQYPRCGSRAHKTVACVGVVEMPSTSRNRTRNQSSVYNMEGKVWGVSAAGTMRQNRSARQKCVKPDRSREARAVATRRWNGTENRYCESDTAVSVLRPSRSPGGHCSRRTFVSVGAPVRLSAAVCETAVSRGKRVRVWQVAEGR